LTKDEQFGMIRRMNPENQKPEEDQSPQTDELSKLQREAEEAAIRNHANELGRMSRIGGYEEFIKQNHAPEDTDEAPDDQG
jgi:hypothetical protein